MLRFLLRRLTELVLTLLAASFLVYGSVFLAPGKPETFLLGGRGANPEALAAIRAQYHLDEPFAVQYAKWLGSALTGDFGQSVQYRSDVLGLVGARLPGTLVLIAMAATLVIVVGLVLGWVGAVRGGALDSAVLVGTSVAVATPSFVAAIVLLAVFSVQLGWFPTLGSGAGPLDMLYHLTLPSIALALPFVGVLARVTRAAMLEQLGREHVAVARSRGIPERTVIRRHVLRNALGTVVTQGGLTLSGLVICTILVESAFGLGGLGEFLARSVTVKDYPVVQAVSLLVVGLFVLVNLVIDLVHPWLDPRVALGTRSAA
ncbi:ABC transporter permease [Streptomyces sp. NBC_01304]|uniref:ABC transporter permease n=1 Tax=Streptomyces sp. NBC_01304 TaxID=2903818 RepID=UPI002E125D6D|nr:ABC transporter permease [Streptomyces sp. NBC_01304]